MKLNFTKKFKKKKEKKIEKNVIFAKKKNISHEIIVNRREFNVLQTILVKKKHQKKIRK